MTAPQQPPGGQREDDALALGAAVGALMTRLQDALLAVLASALEKVLGGRSIASLARSVHLQGMALVNHTIQLVDADLAAAAEDIARQAQDSLSTAAGRAVPRHPITTGPGPGAPSFDQHLTQLAASIRDAGLNALREVDDIFRQAAEKATADHATGTQAAQRMLDHLADHGITVFTDARGREWDLAAYCEMATRTAATRLSLLTQLGLMGPAGMDLVVVDNPSGMPGCRKCAPYEGRVLSLSGRHLVGELAAVTDGNGQRRSANVVSSLADAVAHGLLHPNCRHYLVPFVDGAVHLPLVGSQRGFIQGGQPIYRPVPAAHDSAAYAAEQHQRALERAVRAADARRQVALTPLARGRARTQLGAARQQLAAHVAEHGLTRQRYREHPTKAR